MNRDKILFVLQLAFTGVVCAFLVVPVGLSILAGLTSNYFTGLSSGLTLRWLGEVWDGYRQTLFLSIGLSLACLAGTLLLGVPTAYLLARSRNRFSRAVEELLGVVASHLTTVEQTQGRSVAVQLQQFAFKPCADTGLLLCRCGRVGKRCDLRAQGGVVVVDRHFGCTHAAGVDSALCGVRARGVALGA